jgi:hypothetical protein
LFNQENSGNPGFRSRRPNLDQQSAMFACAQKKNVIIGWQSWTQLKHYRMDQGCQIFLGPNIPKWENTK